MRLICPHCMSAVTVPDDAAGKETTCPNCGKAFPTPSRYSAAVVPDPAAVAGSIDPVRSAPHPEPPTPPAPAPGQGAPTAPSGYVPPAPPPAPAQAPSGFLPTAPAPAGVPAQAGYTKSVGFIVSPKVVGLLPAVLLTLTFVLTFFSWVGTHLGGHPIYSQGPWRAVTGNVGRNQELEKVAPPGTIGWPETKVRSDWLLMVPFLLLLILATALALADHLLPESAREKVPPLVQIWPMRHTIIAALSVAALALVVIQSINGFGLERGARQVVRDNPTLAKTREAAQGSEWKLATVDQAEEDELAKFGLSRTLWMHLAVTCLALGTLAAIGTILLDGRGNKPPPKLLLHY
jgi:hypothetical protein